MKTTLLLIARPETTPLLEAERSSIELHELGIDNQLLIINGVLIETSDDISQKISAKQHISMENMPHTLKKLKNFFLLIRSYNILGLDNIRAFFNMIHIKKLSHQ